MDRPVKILLLEDSKTDAELIQRKLKKEKKKLQFRLVMQKEDFIQALEEFHPDVILSDNSLPSFNAVEALLITREKQLFIPFILVTGTVSEEYAAEIIKKGADDYVLKDRIARLPAAIEAALKKRKYEKEVADYKYALDESADVTIADQNGTIIYANENFCRLYGYAKEELTGRNHRIINSGLHPSSFFRELWETIAKGDIWQGDVRNKAKSGEYKWAETTIVPLLDNNGKPYQYLSIRRDITKRKKAEENLLQTQARLKQAQEIAHLGNWELNFKTGLTKWSDEAYRIYGLEPGDHNLSFEDWLSFIHPDDVDYVKNEVEKSQANFSDISFHHRIIREDGIIRHIYTESKYEFDQNRKAIGLYGIAHDITEIRKLEEEMLEQQRQEQIKITATAMEAQEKERNAIGQELHDNVNQILVGTKLMLSMVKANPGRSQEIVDSSINNLQDAINENRKISHVMVAPDLESNKLVEQIDNLIATMLESAGLKVEFDTKGLDENLLDEKRKINIYRIAQEQCTNIVKYAKATSVKVLLETNNNFFKMIIADDGVGMEPDKQITGIGLRNINGRLSIFNGLSKITTAPRKGFSLEIKLPY